ncbi:MAG: cytochrome C [Rubrivivax sp.]|nr:cytochrome C [Rubrivivax sp.]
MAPSECRFAGRDARRLLAYAAATLLVLLAGLLPAPVLAQNIESVLRPGDVIRGHARWEEECTQCHVRFDRNAQSELCMGCHKDVGADVRQRTGYHGRLKPQPCRSCHTDHKGRDARIAEFDPQRFDHTQTDYALRGRHATAECRKCHQPARKYSQAPSDCLSCHRADDTHKGRLGPACADCHTEQNWKQTRFDHSRTRFALTGKHVDTKCEDCHNTSNPKDAPRECVGCHKKDDDGTRGHRGRYGDKCDTCHGTKAWKPSIFDHDERTKFSLRGRHRTATCTACHTGHLYRDKVGSACIDCHRKDDKHEGALGRECQACHGEQNWKDTPRFDHDRTRYPLLGKHRDARCDACHKDRRYQGTATTCVACHRADDRHKPSLGDDCAACHVEQGWKQMARFDHQRTRFALEGRHRDTRCEACHKDANYRATPSDCNACHRGDDKHAATLGPRCADCHDARAWKPAPRFDHQRTKFPLRNAHAARTVACTACHADAKQMRSTPLECNACHARDDKHAGQLGTRCDSCHTDVRWTDTRFDHARARFPLLGRHLAVRCSGCHTSPRYRDASRECVGCHQKEDKHAQRFGTLCESCHNARSWRLWSYDHAARARYALDGAHARITCEACHKEPAPRGRAAAELSTLCGDCHQKDDRHQGAFGPQCDRCHGTGDWKTLRHRGTSLKPSAAGPAG